MTHAEAIEIIRNGGPSVRLLVRRGGKVPPPPVGGKNSGINKLRSANAVCVACCVTQVSGYDAQKFESLRSLPLCLRPL
jgi:hypothetical protein